MQWEDQICCPQLDPQCLAPYMFLLVMGVILGEHKCTVIYDLETHISYFVWCPPKKEWVRGEDLPLWVC